MKNHALINSNTELESFVLAHFVGYLFAFFVARAGQTIMKNNFFIY